jgi:titin
VISGNATDGVVLDGTAAYRNSVEGNFIGLNAAGAAALPNGRYGVRASGGASSNMIGRSKGHNVISGNGSSGIAVMDAGTGGNRILGNLIGTDPAGAKGVANGADGVSITGGGGNTVGGSAVAVRNVISGNTGSGVALTGPAANRNSVLGDFIGTNAGGSAALPNGANGITISGSSKYNRIGEQVLDGFLPDGATQLTAKGNLISGNAGSGIVISGLSPAHGDTSTNFVFSNFIGTDVSGTVALGNGQDGILIDSTAGNSIGGSPQQGGGVEQGRNLISGNTQMGIDIRGAGSTGNKVHANLIGTDASGSAALGNNRYGVVIQDGASGNAIGGKFTALPNVISGNKVSGVIVRGAGTDSNLLAGNLIGTNSAGTAALPNAQHGIEVTLGAAGTTIGGNTADLRNVISGNPGSGIRATTGTTGTTVQGNFIGTDAGGTLALGNGVNGVLLAGSSGNLVGGLSAKVKNVIAFNGGSGVKVDTANADQILGNSIDQNGSLGIALVGGGNDNQAAPTIVQVKSDTLKTTVKATLASLPSTTFRIELFSSPACDPSGGGEGATFLGTKTITTDGTGAATFSIQVAVVPAGQALTETATRQDVTETSQFSACASS